MDLATWDVRHPQFLVWCAAESGATFVDTYSTEAGARSAFDALIESREYLDWTAEVERDGDEVHLIQHATLVREDHRLLKERNMRGFPGVRIPRVRQIVDRISDVPGDGEYVVVWHVIVRDGKPLAVGHIAESEEAASEEVRELGSKERIRAGGARVVHWGQKFVLYRAAAEKLTVQTLGFAIADGDRLVERAPLATATDANLAKLLQPVPDKAVIADPVRSIA